MSFPTCSIWSKGWHVNCGQLSWKAKECRELGRHYMYGYITEQLSVLYQHSTHASNQVFLIQGLETTAQVIWLGNGSRLLPLRNTSKPNSICAAASMPQALAY